MAELIHTNKFNGDGTVWLNKGRKDIGGSRWDWDPQGVCFQGAQAGSCTYFPDLDGNGRADMHVITHSMRNTAETWFSCCGRVNKKGDNGIVINPNLPQMPPATRAEVTTMTIKNNNFRRKRILEITPRNHARLSLNYA
jgi:hypothetical protein